MNDDTKRKALVEIFRITQDWASGSMDLDEAYFKISSQFSQSPSSDASPFPSAEGERREMYHCQDCGTLIGSIGEHDASHTIKRITVIATQLNGQTIIQREKAGSVIHKTTWFLIQVKDISDVGINELRRILVNSVGDDLPKSTDTFRCWRSFRLHGIEVHPNTPEHANGCPLRKYCPERLTMCDHAKDCDWFICSQRRKAEEAKKKQEEDSIDGQTAT